MWRFGTICRGSRLWLSIGLLCAVAVLVVFIHYKRTHQHFEQRSVENSPKSRYQSSSLHRFKITDFGSPVKAIKDTTVRRKTTTPKSSTTSSTTPSTTTRTTKTTTTTTTTTATKAPTVTIRLIPETDTLRTWSHLQLHKFYHSYIMSPQIPCSAVERMGKIKDGGWEFCDDPLYRPPDRTNCLVYSFGINYDFSYDDDIAEYGCEVHAFDPSMRGTKDHLRGKRVHFHPLGIGDKDGATFQSDHQGTWKLYSLKGFRQLFGHQVNKRRVDVVKMDVEGHELESLTQALRDGSLSDVRQLVFETHVTWGPSDATKEQYIKFLELLRGVYNAGFRIYTTHRNHVWSAFTSQLTGKERTKCHEIHTVNINLRQKPQQAKPQPKLTPVQRQRLTPVQRQVPRMEVKGHY